MPVLKTLAVAVATTSTSTAAGHLNLLQISSSYTASEGINRTGTIYTVSDGVNRMGVSSDTDKWIFTPGGSTVALAATAFGTAAAMVKNVDFRVEAEAAREMSARLIQFSDQTDFTCGACVREGRHWCTGSDADASTFFGSCVSSTTRTALVDKSTPQCFSHPGECPTLRVARELLDAPQSLSIRRTHPDGRPEWDNTPYVDKKSKFIFCEIPKVGCTDFKRLFRRLSGAPDYESQEAWVHDPKKSGVTRITDLPKEEAIAILKDPGWTKAVFVRDPLERLLSGYLDKCREPVEKRYDIHCPFSGSVTFGTFMQYIFDQAKRSPHGLMSMDEHWRPQHLVCDLTTWLPYYQFQGNFSHLQTHTKFLLQGIGIFDKFGTGWGDDGKDIFQVKVDWHHTDTTEKLRKYYTKALADKALNFYATDYEMFALPIPSWYYELI